MMECLYGGRKGSFNAGQLQESGYATSVYFKYLWAGKSNTDLCDLIDFLKL